ncbi:hypothetical protein V6N13_119135 [Hibiscus sabdariffa]
MRCSICWNFGSTLGRVTWVYWKDTRWIILHTWNSLLPYAPWLVKNVCGDGMSYRILCRSCTVAYSSYKATIGCKTLSRTPKGQGLSIAALLWNKKIFDPDCIDSEGILLRCFRLAGEASGALSSRRIAR